MEVDPRRVGSLAATGRAWNVLGVPIRVVAGATELAEIATEALGPWPDADDDSLGPQIELWPAAVDDEPDAAAVRPPQIGGGDRFSVRLGRTVLFADRAEGSATAHITRSVMSDRPRCAQLVETMALFLASARRPATLHAAAVGTDAGCILLAADSGVGKSTLAWGCVRAGLLVVSDDVVFVEDSASDLVAWGNPWRVMLLPDAERFFPEARNAPRVWQLNGELKIRMASPPQQCRSHLPIQGVLAVSRTAGPPALAAAGPEEVAAGLVRFKDSPPLRKAAMAEVAARLASARIGRLLVGSDPAGAVPLVRRWLK
jgi:hypothetical protein